MCTCSFKGGFSGLDQAEYKCAWSGVIQTAQRLYSDVAKKRGDEEKVRDVPQLPRPAGEEHEACRVAVVPVPVFDVSKEIFVKRPKQQQPPGENTDIADAAIALELAMFRNFVVEEEVKDPLQWWQVNGPRFPTAALLARRYLSMPASSAPSEAVFSRMNVVINARRGRTLPERTEKMVMMERNSHLRKIEGEGRGQCPFCVK